MRLGRAFGVELIEEAFEMVLVGGLIFGGQGDYVPRETVAQRVQGRAGLPAGVRGLLECWALTPLMATRSEVAFDSAFIGFPPEL